MSSNNVSVSFSIYSIAGKGFTPESRPIQVDLTLHQNRTYGDKGGILANLGANLTLEEAEEMIAEIKQAIIDAEEELQRREEEAHEKEGLYPELSEYSTRGW